MKAKKLYETECCRCGMCCLVKTCEIGQMVFGISAEEPCHALQWEESTGMRAICRLAEKGMVPVGDGCCIKATVVIRGTAFDFSSLPAAMKFTAVREIKQGRVPLLTRRAG